MPLGRQGIFLPQFNPMQDTAASAAVGRGHLKKSIFYHFAARPRLELRHSNLRQTPPIFQVHPSPCCHAVPRPGVPVHKQRWPEPQLSVISPGAALAAGPALPSVVTGPWIPLCLHRRVQARGVLSSVAALPSPGEGAWAGAPRQTAHSQPCRRCGSSRSQREGGRKEESTHVCQSETFPLASELTAALI